jgi:polar amino acid transport system permease protein
MPHFLDPRLCQKDVVVCDAFAPLSYSNPFIHGPALAHPLRLRPTVLWRTGHHYSNHVSGHHGRVGIGAGAGADLLLAWLLRAARGITLAYVTFFRGTPLFVQILLVHFALMPALIHPDTGLLLAGDAARELRQAHGAFFSGALALSLNAGAYISEILRAGIQSIDRGQTQAAYSLGMTHRQSLRSSILPQAFVRMMPALVNEGVTLIKDSSLVSAIGLAELALAARTVAGAYSRYWEPYLAVSAVYLVLTLLLSLLAKRLEVDADQRGR